jgi:hypothetical protein
MEKLMAVRPESLRSFAYNLKTDPERVKQISQARHQQMTEVHTALQLELVKLELRAKQELGRAGVPGIAYVGYLNYCRELWKKNNKLSSASFWLEVGACKAKWVARQLDGDILETLARELFGQTDASQTEPAPNPQP